MGCVLKITTFLFYMFLVVFVVSSALYSLNLYDEGVILVGAGNILKGLIPYKDFWTLYTPGQFYLFAILEVFSKDVLILRVFSLLINFALIFVGYKFFDKRKNITWLYLLIVASVFSLYPLFFRSVISGVTLISANLIFLIKYFRSSNKKYLLYAGSIMGFAAIFRHDMAGISYLIFIILLPMIDIKFNKINFKQSLKSLLYYILGTSLIFIPLLLYFLINVKSDELINQLIYFPMNDFSNARELGLPNFIDLLSLNSIKDIVVGLWESLLFYFPVLIGIYTFIRIILNFKSISNDTKIILYLLISTSFVFYVHALLRPDTEHVIPSVIISLIILLKNFELTQNNKFQKFVKATLIIFFVTVPIMYKIIDLNRYVINGTKFNSENISYIYGPKYGGELINKVSNAIESNTNINDKIYLAPGSHFKVDKNAILLYYMTNRQPAVKYYEVHPGISDSKPVQNYLIKNLKLNNAKLIVKEHIYSLEDKSNTTIIDKYISNNYIKINNYDNFDILIRKMH